MSFPLQNFIGHINRGTYDHCEFFRVIKGFMAQTGDPRNNGTGGESIWGGEFEDEIIPTRNFSQPGLLAMANVSSRLGWTPHSNFSCLLYYAPFLLLTAFLTDLSNQLTNLSSGWTKH